MVRGEPPPEHRAEGAPGLLQEVPAAVEPGGPALPFGDEPRVGAARPRPEEAQVARRPQGGEQRGDEGAQPPLPADRRPGRDQRGGGEDQPGGPGEPRQQGPQPRQQPAFVQQRQQRPGGQRGEQALRVGEVEHVRRRRGRPQQHREQRHPVRVRHRRPAPRGQPQRDLPHEHGDQRGRDRPADQRGEKRGHQLAHAEPSDPRGEQRVAGEEGHGARVDAPRPRRQRAGVPVPHQGDVPAAVPAEQHLAQRVAAGRGEGQQQAQAGGPDRQEHAGGGQREPPRLRQPPRLRPSGAPGGRGGWRGTGRVGWPGHDRAPRGGVRRPLVVSHASPLPHGAG